MEGLRLQARYESALIALGADFIILRVKRFLLVNGGGYSQKALAELLDVPRRTLGQRVALCVEWGAMRVESDGVHLTSDGRAMFSQVHKEALAISNGQVKGFSPDLVSGFARLAPDRCDPQKALSVAF